MIAFNAVTGDKILFVGEGNFSFCVDFIKQHINILDILSDFEVIATCFEPDKNLSEIKKSNIEFLRQKGVPLLFDVDAKRLKDHPSIGCKVFTKIIFNFPHVGGKMKINLNRELLREFFLNSKLVLDENGVILLTLCDGQGGTDADTNKRRWDDTWKVVELAAEVDFALKSVHKFNRDFFPGYINVGYRSLEKGFNTDNALTHVFKICKHDLITNLKECDIRSLFNTEKPLFGEYEVSKVYSKKLSQNPLNNMCSPQLFLYECFRKVMYHKEIKFYDNMMLLYGYSCANMTSCDALKEHLDLGVNNFESFIGVYKGMCLHRLNSDFCQQPVSCEIICVGRDSLKYVFKMITEVVVSFKGLERNVVQYDVDDQELICIENWNRLDVAKKDSILLNGRKIDACTILLDNFAIGVFNLSGWHELWAKNSKIVKNGSEIQLLTPCIYPHAYIFDLSFSVLKELFVEEDFIKILWHTAGDIIFDTELISTYDPPNKAGYKNFCYRIKYRSYDVPLFKKRVIEIQRILGQILGEMLNITVL